MFPCSFGLLMWWYHLISILNQYEMLIIIKALIEKTKVHVNTKHTSIKGWINSLYCFTNLFNLFSLSLLYGVWNLDVAINYFTAFVFNSAWVFLKGRVASPIYQWSPHFFFIVHPITKNFLAYTRHICISIYL